MNQHASGAGNVGRRKSVAAKAALALACAAAVGLEACGESGTEATTATPRPEVVVPNVVGLPAEQAREILHRRGFLVDERVVVSFGDPAVSRQLPGGGSRVRQGAKVIMLVKRPLRRSGPLTEVSLLSSAGLEPALQGASLADVQEYAGARLDKVAAGTGECQTYRLPNGPAGVTLGFLGDVLQTVEVTSPQIRTLRGITVGSNVIDVRKRYPVRDERAGGSVIIVPKGSPDVPTRLVFTVGADRRVQVIRAGRTKATIGAAACWR